MTPGPGISFPEPIVTLTGSNHPKKNSYDDLACLIRAVNVIGPLAGRDDLTLTSTASRWIGS